MITPRTSSRVLSSTGNKDASHYWKYLSLFKSRGPPRRVSAYEISKSTGFHVDFGFQIGFLDFTWISGFHVDFWISGFQSGFLDFKVDFRISKWISGFQNGFLLIFNWIFGRGLELRVLACGV